MYRLSEEETLIQKTVRDFATRELGPLVAEAECSGRFPREQILPRMASLGLLSICVPPELGGVGGSTLMLCIVAEEVARMSGGFAIGAMASVVAPSALVKLSGGKVAAPVLDSLVQGMVMPAMAFTEPGAGSDLMAIRTKVTKTDRGLVLDGSKAFISNGPTADVYLVAAVRAEVIDAPREERTKGLGVYVVPRGLDGFTIGKPLHKLGMRSSETGELHFDSVVLPAGPSLGSTRSDGDKKSGMRAMMDLLDYNRLYIAALSIGIAQAAFEASLEYVKQRRAFDKPIGHHQATGFKVARMAVKLDAARALVQRGCELYDAGVRCAREVAEAKLYATEAAVEITGEAVQIHGAYGYSQEFPVERYFRDAKVGTIWEGTSEIQQQIICRELGLYD
ncbi:MAG: acyl-CoA dehydrogenase family protein [Deltaproteobacteria bacterium]|nr:acyl-CoA dehydrogenase family protein [Deltaproteobacteria bacterium]